MVWNKVLRKNFSYRSLGFTTVELVVVVGIIVGLTAISGVMVRHYTPTYNSKQAASNVVSQMQLARIHSIKNRVTTVVVFYPESFTVGGRAGSFMIYEDNNNNWVQDLGENTILPRTYMPSKVTLISAAFDSNGSGGALDTTCYGFDSQGLAARNGAVYVAGDVELENSRNEKRRITFNASGKAKTSIL